MRYFLGVEHSTAARVSYTTERDSDPRSKRLHLDIDVPRFRCTNVSAELQGHTRFSYCLYVLGASASVKQSAV